MKNIQTIGLLSALLWASVASAQESAIDWLVTAWPSGIGWLPKIASSGHNGVISLMYQTGTGDAKLEYLDGFMVVSAPGTVTWNVPQPVNTNTNPSPEGGHEPSIAMVDCLIPACSGPNYIADVIQVHQGSGDNGAALWFRTGVDTGSGPTNWANSQQYDQGYNPNVAVDQSGGGNSSSTVVEVHQGAVGSSELWYHVGTLTYSASSVSVTWGPPYKTGFTGYAPTVSVSRGVVVLMAQGTAPHMWYSVGAVDTANNTIPNWSPQTNYDTGYNPSVSVQWAGETAGPPTYDAQGWGDFTVVEAHQGGTGTGSLYYRIGAMNYGSGGSSAPTSITWTPNATNNYSTDYSTGCYPSVSLMANVYGYQIVESHSIACGGPADIHTRWGTVRANYVPN